jgi:hypothetical protein
MEISRIEKLFQEDFKWQVNALSDMCAPDDITVQELMNDIAYFDENTWEPLDRHLVEEAEKAELMRFQQMGVYTHVPKKEALMDPDAVFVKVKWVRTNKGTVGKPNVKCRLVAQELGYGQRIDELFSGTPSLVAMKVAMLHAAKGARHNGLMVMDVPSCTASAAVASTSSFLVVILVTATVILWVVFRRPCTAPEMPPRFGPSRSQGRFRNQHLAAVCISPLN